MRISDWSSDVCSSDLHLSRQNMKRIFSGVQPSGNLHLGNYLGAIRKFVALQNDFECIYCVVDQHAITLWQDTQVLRQRTRGVTAGYLARAEERRVGTAWVSTCRSRWSSEPEKKQNVLQIRI